jgi:hypothetical protein
LLATLLVALAGAFAGALAAGLAGASAAALAAGIDRLHYFVFTSSLFSYRLKGTLVATSLARTF